MGIMKTEKEIKAKIKEFEYEAEHRVYYDHHYVDLRKYVELLNWVIGENADAAYLEVNLRSREED